jgi:transcriptional regulator with XRE-family HTH domain
MTMPLTTEKTSKTNKTFDRKMGRRVRDLRDASGMSQMTLAEKTNMDFTKLSRVESGQRKLSLREGVELARALGVTMNQFTQV